MPPWPSVQCTPGRRRRNEKTKEKTNERCCRLPSSFYLPRSLRQPVHLLPPRPFTTSHWRMPRAHDAEPGRLQGQARHAVVVDGRSVAFRITQSCRDVEQMGKEWEASSPQAGFPSHFHHPDPSASPQPFLARHPPYHATFLVAVDSVGVEFLPLISTKSCAPTPREFRVVQHHNFSHTHTHTRGQPQPEGEEEEQAEEEGTGERRERRLLYYVARPRVAAMPLHLHLLRLPSSR